MEVGSQVVPVVDDVGLPDRKDRVSSELGSSRQVTVAVDRDEDRRLRDLRPCYSESVSQTLWLWPPGIHPERVVLDIEADPFNRPIQLLPQVGFRAISPVREPLPNGKGVLENRAQVGREPEAVLTLCSRNFSVRKTRSKRHASRLQRFTEIA